MGRAEDDFYPSEEPDCPARSQEKNGKAPRIKTAPQLAENINNDAAAVMYE